MEAARGSAPGELPALPVGDPGIRRHYLLALPDGVTADEVEVLALSRFPGATWQVPPRIAAPGSAARPSPGVLRLSRHTTLTGPYGLGPRDAVSLGLPSSTASVFDVTTGDNTQEGSGVPGFAAGTGWDAVTGLGTPADAQAFVHALAGS